MKRLIKASSDIEEQIKFNDRYFPRIDLTDKSRYKSYKYRGKHFVYDTKDSLVLYVFQDEDEVAQLGADAPYREADAMGLSKENWKDIEMRKDYLDVYIFELNYL